MKQILCLTVFIAWFIYADAQSRVPDSLLAGKWQGNLITLWGDLRIVIEFEKKDNKWCVSMQSPDQSEKKFDTDLEIIGDSINLDISGSGLVAEYAGVYNKDSAAILGKFTQRKMRFPLKLAKGETEDVLYHRPQNPVEPFPYYQEEVTIYNKKGDDTLAGTFTRPMGNGKFPAVVLVTGSGAQDRNEALMGHKPFLVLSDYLTRRGFAVLRCDDRGTAKSTGDFKNATSEDFACDAEAQIDYLKSRKDVDISKIGIIGHSEGGMIAEIIAARRPDVAFIVLMAGPAMNIYDMMIMQDSLIALNGGQPDNNLETVLVRQRKLFNMVKTTDDSTRLADRIDSLLLADKAQDYEIERALRQLMSPWFKWFIRYDPAENLKKLHCAVLSIGGDKDIQVPAIANNEALEKLYKSTGYKNYKIVILPGLNHLLQKCKLCTIAEYKHIDETINPVALKTMGDWLEKTVIRH